MKILMYTAIMILAINLILVLMLNLISKKSLMDREKSSPFECGFDPNSSSRIPFSLQFFLIAVIFLIFDVEITLLLPLVVTMKTTSMLNYSILTTLFIVILLIGLFHEWNQGALNWAY